MSKEHSQLLPEEVNEKCGIFGIYDPNHPVVPVMQFGLFSLQHRGQEGSGITTSDHERLTTYKKTGLVSQVFDSNDFDMNTLPGDMAIGHNRYGTTSIRSVEHHLQPVTSQKNLLTLAHNGNLPDTTRLETFMDENCIPNPGFNDSEMMHAAVEYYLEKGASLEEAAKEAYPLFTGAFSLLLMDKNQIVALRDSKGIRPLSLGRKNGGYVLSSETCAFDSQDNIVPLREIHPGEMVILDENGMRSEALEKGEQKLDIFEMVYFSRPDSNLMGKTVYKIREQFGRRLAQEKRIEGDIVIGVPDSGSPAAHGYARESKIPKEEGLIKNRYVARTFINPGDRAAEVHRKFIPITEVLRDQRIIVVDDSIVRGTTTKELVKILRNNGAREVHLVITSPPVRYPDFYGIDTPHQKDLFANKHESNEEMRLALSADSLTFLSYEGMIESTGLPEDVFSTSSFSGKYPIDIGKRKEEVVWSQR